MNKLLAIEVFIAVAEQGGFSAAMKQLDISRAGISKYIAELEAALGGRLFNRTTRKVSLTEAGHAYYARCKDILGSIEEADSIVSGLTSSPTGRLRINAPMSFGIRQMGPLVAEFHHRYPNLKVELILADRMVDMVEEAFDVTVRISRPKDSSLVARKIAPCNFVMAASPEYIEQHGYPASAADLVQHNCLCYTYGSARTSWPLWLDGCQTSVKIKPSLESNNGDVLCAAAVAAMGIVLSPTFILCDALRSGQLVPLLQQYSVKPSGIYAVFASSRLVSAKVRLWVDFLVEKLGDNPHWDQIPNRVQ